MSRTYLNIDEQTLSLIKWPPNKSPEVEYGTDRDTLHNNLRGVVIQTAYRYIYDDNEKSVFSPLSQVVIPQIEEYYNGYYVNNYNLNNFFASKIELGHHTVDVIEVAARLGNNRDLFVYDLINKFTSLGIHGRLVKGSNVIFCPHPRNTSMDVSELRPGMVLNIDDNIFPHETFILKIDNENRKIYVSENSYKSTIITIEDCPIREDIYYSIFRNNETRIGLDQEDALRAFDDVPLTSQSLKILQNRLWLANNKKGFDNVEVDLHAELIVSEDENYMEIMDFDQTYLCKYTGPYQNHENEDTIILKLHDTTYDNVLIKLDINYEDGTKRYVTYSSGDNESLSDVVDGFVDNVDIPDLIWAGIVPVPTWTNLMKWQTGSTVNYQDRIYLQSNDDSLLSSIPTSDPEWWIYLGLLSERNNIIMIKTGGSGAKRISSISANIPILNTKHTSLKTGTDVQYAIEYLDRAGRKGGANTNSNCIFNIPDHKELRDDENTLNLANYLWHKIHIKNRPPEWAYYYRILRDDDVPSFFQFYVNSLRHDTPDIFEYGGKQCINVNRNILTLIDKLPKTRISTYKYTEGDKIKIFARKLEISGNNSWATINVRIEKQIIGEDFPMGEEYYQKDDNNEYITDNNGNKIKNPESGFIIIEPFTFEELFYLRVVDYVIYEIYNPGREETVSKRFYQLSKTLEIGNPGMENRYHKGVNSLYDQDPEDLTGTPAQEWLYGVGNVYKINRFSGADGLYLTVESKSVSDFYESDSISKGLANIETPDLGQTQEDESIQYSGKYFAGTRENYLSRFISTDKKQLGKSNGGITGLVEMGFILKVVQPIKVTSLYIERTVAHYGDQEQVLLTNNVIGYEQPFSDNHGTEIKTSIVKSGTHFYFFNNRSGQWIRSAYNGNIPISDYKFKTAIKELSDGINSSNHNEVFAMYDEHYKELMAVHYFTEDLDSKYTIHGTALNNSREITNVGITGGTNISELEIGMIIDLDTSDVKADVETFITLIDSENKKIYMNKPLQVADGGTPDFTTALVYRKMIAKTYSFYEPKNRWKEQVDIYPEYMGSINNKLVSFSAGHIWVHHSLKNTGEYVYNNFYGVQYPLKIRVVSNVDPANVKLYRGITENATKAIGAINKGDIKIKSYDKSGQDMESKLPAALLKNIEGHYDSEFLRDMNTPGFTNDIYALRNGRDLRGQAAILTFTDNENDEFVLFNIILYIDQS